MIYLIDTNVILRFLLGDEINHYKKSVEIFEKIEKGEIFVEILPSVLMEVYFVLTKFYKINKKEVLNDLKKILLLNGIVGEKVILYETLTLLEEKKLILLML